MALEGRAIRLELPSPMEGALRSLRVRRRAVDERREILEMEHGATVVGDALRRVARPVLSAREHDVRLVADERSLGHEVVDLGAKYAGAGAAETEGLVALKDPAFSKL